MRGSGKWGMRKGRQKEEEEKEGDAFEGGRREERTLF